MGRGGRGGGRGGREPLPRSVQVSKKLSYLLRHGAEKEGLELDASGFVNVQEILENRNFRSLKVTFDEVRDIVRENDKQRFSMVPVASTPAAPAEADGEEANGQPPLPSDDPKDWKIRANQGHSLKVESEGLLQPVTADNIPKTAVHGTTHAAWPLIVASGGLKPMGRNHVHFASGLPAGFMSIRDLDGDTAAAPPVISGMRKSSTILMFLDVRKAMEAGLKFGTSDNGVVLTEGNQKGLVPLEFFQRVEDCTGAGVLVEDGKIAREAPEEWAGKGKGKGKG
ncbi:tRNA 2'-phosphotransferase [Vermiconidia calcicola]|uniref:tRNA 2'-phosphotransferase n=1 Tax=Vermiconidia calcicola TaxID=1690605 RepID=A0ACC3NVS5_9PEZI|nr:tRNA 2'-phosphotransferase [Vermiconidia calcicola]